MHIMQTGCYYFTQDEAKRIVSFIKEKLECFRFFRFKICKSV